MSSGETPNWGHPRPPELTIRQPQNIDLPLTDVAYPLLGWAPRTSSGTSRKKYLNDTKIPEAKFKL